MEYSTLSLDLYTSGLLCKYIFFILHTFCVFYINDINNNMLHIFCQNEFYLQQFMTRDTYIITAVQSVYIRYNHAEQFEFVICTLRNVHSNGNQIKLNFIPIYATQLTNRRKILLYSKEKSWLRHNIESFKNSRYEISTRIDTSIERPENDLARYWS